jgi:8-oxo-dGTP pyrophosphatase MutT (NUDIX family)
MALLWLRGGLCFLHKDGKTRLADFRNHYHKIHAGKCSPNGGKIEEGETSQAAITREMLEETGTEVRNLTYRGRVHFNNEKRTVEGKPMKFNMVVDLWDCNEFEEGQLPVGQAPVIWVEDKEMMNLALHEGDKRVWEWLQEHPLFEGVIVQDGEHLVEEESKIISLTPAPLC